MIERFSDRYGYRGEQKEISVREGAPEGLRFAIPLIAQEGGMRPTAMRRAICQVLLVRPNPSNWSDYPNVWHEVNELIEECTWFKVYNIAESICADMANYEPEQAEFFEDRLNQYLVENGIGWQMKGGKILYRGSETFAEVTRDATATLEGAGRHVARKEIHEALQDISRRPVPDVTGAIQHAIAALECVARDVAGEPKATLGRLIPKLALSPPLDTAVEKLWGYASERARHVREGEAVSTEEAELIVSVACSICTFLSRSESESE